MMTDSFNDRDLLDPAQLFGTSHTNLIADDNQGKSRRDHIWEEKRKQKLSSGPVSGNISGWRDNMNEVNKLD